MKIAQRFIAGTPSVADHLSPGGTIEINRPSGTGIVALLRSPSDKSLGYSRMSLRDKAGIPAPFSPQAKCIAVLAPNSPEPTRIEPRFCREIKGSLMAERSDSVWQSPMEPRASPVRPAAHSC